MAAFQFKLAVESPGGEPDIWHIWLTGNDATLCGDRGPERRDEPLESRGLLWVECNGCRNMHRFITTGTTRQTRG